MIFTSYFNNIQNLQKLGYQNFISIAGQAPKWYMFNKYIPLMPKYSWWKEWHDYKLSINWYQQKYFNTVLRNLNINTVILDLGNNPILLCHQLPNQFCHRHLVAKWLNMNGHKCIQL